MTKEEAIRRQKLIETVMNAQAIHYAENPTRAAQYQPEIGGYVAPGAGAEMIDPIIWDELNRTFTADQYAELFNKKK